MATQAIFGLAALIECQLQVCIILNIEFKIYFGQHVLEEITFPFCQWALGQVVPQRMPKR